MSIATLYEFIGREAASRGRRARQQAIISAMRNMLLVCALFIAAAAQPLCPQQGAGPIPPAMPDAPPVATGAGPVHENLVYGVADGQALLLDIFEPANNDGLPPPRHHSDPWRRVDQL
jgi:hypothetical protein